MKREWDAWLPVTFYHSRDQQQPPTTYHRLPAYLSTTSIHKKNSFDCDKNGTKEHVATTSALDDRVVVRLSPPSDLRIILYYGYGYGALH